MEETPRSIECFVVDLEKELYKFKQNWKDAQREYGEEKFPSTMLVEEWIEQFLIALEFMEVE